MSCVAAALQSIRHPFVIIGYGNSLRGDDAVGLKVASAIAAWGLPNVRSLVVPQLTPELAETLSETAYVIFVHALPAELGLDVKVHSLSLAEVDVSVSSGDSEPTLEEPRSLLSLTYAQYGHCPTAWWVEVPATHFEASSRLSTVAEQGLSDAVEEIDQIIRSQSHPHPVF